MMNHDTVSSRLRCHRRRGSMRRRMVTDIASRSDRTVDADGAGRRRLAGTSLDHNAQRLLERLTPREYDVLQLLSEGLSDKDIATRLFVSKATIHTHMANLLSKLQVDSRLQALIFAIRHGVTTLD